MRQNSVTVATTALVTAIVAIWGTTVIIAHAPKNPTAATVSSSIDVMQLTRDAKNLPDEKFDAY